jgi:phosphoribosylaminoimidazolecarboxamide formyltransferase/IMP cyclohydrolase
MSILRALISVSDKQQLVPFAQGLSELNIEIISTGGTARALREEGVSVTPIEVLTNFPEMLGGRVKTLHPMIHGGLLARRTLDSDKQDLERHGIVTIDLLVVNLYPFEATINQPGVTLAQAIEKIDIGGVALLRAAAKNWEDVTVVCDPADYEDVLAQLRETRHLDYQTRARLAAKAFRHTAYYDTIISRWLTAQLDPTPGASQTRSASSLQEVRSSPTGPGEITDADAEPADLFPETIAMQLARAELLRYGENPHQQGALYRRPGAGGLADARQLQGKGMSYTNWLDADGAWNAVQSFERPAVVIVKHASPCGIAEADSLATAHRWALACDPVSAFGGIVAVNRPLDLDVATAIDTVFTEVVLAPEYTPEALEFLRKKSNRRLLRVPPLANPTEPEVRSIPGGFIAQERDTIEPKITLRTVSNRKPTEPERAVLTFAWRCVLPVKSNAIVVAKEVEPGVFATVGIGTGQPNRVDSVRHAVTRAGKQAQGAVLASDAFFPFPDGIEVALQAGITAIAHPGGSVRDEEGISVVNNAEATMVFTGVRHFRH